MWLLKCVIGQREEVCLISDRHAGIMSAVANESIGWSNPMGHHRFCLRHVASNFNDVFRSQQLKKLVKIAGYQLQPRKFNKVWQEIELINKDAIE